MTGLQSYIAEERRRPTIYATIWVPLNAEYTTSPTADSVSVGFGSASLQGTPDALIELAGVLLAAASAGTRVTA